MAKNDLVEIMACGNAVEAEQVRATLNHHGVTAFVSGANTQTTLSYVGSALGGVRVLVQSTDASKAIEIVAKLRAEADVATPPWFCGQCEEVIDGAFDVCWGCGRPREEVEQSLPDARESDPEREDRNEIITPAEDHSMKDAASSKAFSPMPTDSAMCESTPGKGNEEVEAMLLRAWRASILGVTFFPLLVYSMYLLFEAANATERFSLTAERRFYRTLVSNVIFGCVQGLMTYAIFW